MKLLFLGVLTFCTAAHSADSIKDPFNDTVTPEVELKAMQGHVDAAISKAVAEALKSEAAPLPYYQSTPAFGSASSDIMTAAFIEAKVPDCLHSEGLKRQPTYFMSGFLALPFIAVAKLRGKCV